MELVKVNQRFYDKCISEHSERELLFNESGRPCVLLIRLKYKEQIHKFVVPIRSNISNKTPKTQYFSLPPNPTTRNGCSHGIHYIKIFPITDEYIDKYHIDKNSYLVGVRTIIAKHESEIVNECQKYLDRCSIGQKHNMTPDIDKILSWLYK